MSRFSDPTPLDSHKISGEGSHAWQSPDAGEKLEQTVLETQKLDNFLWESHNSSALEGLESARFTEKEDEQDDVIGRRFSIYRCDAMLGRGGMGQVYLAYHMHLGRPCALKISTPRSAWTLENSWDMTLQEGRSAASLIHPNIVTVHAVGQEADRHYIEMELVSGGSLKLTLERGGPPPVLRALSWMTSIASGLDYSHRQGILHRDIKPENILLCGRGVPKLADFGLAQKNYKPDHLPTGAIVGTLPYLAPEVLKTGMHSMTSDVYALGVSFYHLLAGRLPYHAKTSDQLFSQVLTEKAPSLHEVRSDIPLVVSECVAELMAKDPCTRPSSGTEAWHLLSSVLGQLRDVESILREALGHDPSVSWLRCDGKYQLTVRLPDGRKQKVFVESSSHRADKQLLLIYSICCPAQSEYYETALRKNSTLSHGGFAIREIEGEPHFVMVDTYPRGTVDSEEVRKSVLELAVHADQVERQLTGRDQN